MERKNIPFQYGIQRSPSVAYDGELSECINLEAHNGELTPSVMPEVAFTMTEGDKLLFVHKFSDYNNFIIQRGESLCWFPDDNKEKVNEIGMIIPTSIHSVGNTLVVLSADKMEYILFKSGNYKRIGSKPPFCSISFGLQATKLGRTNFDFLDQDFIIGLDENNDTRQKYGQELIDNIIKYQNGETETLMFDLENDYDNLESAGIGEEENAKAYFVSKMVAKMTESFHAGININKAIFNKEGAFTDSFFVRYAYRMYDGSHYMHSAPVFFPLSTIGPRTDIRPPVKFGDSGSVIGLTLSMPKQVLDYKIIGFYNDEGKVEHEKLNDWTDIIQGLDIFITKGIPAYNSDAKVFGFTTEYTPASDIFKCGKELSGRHSDGTVAKEGYCYYAYNELNKPRFNVNFQLLDKKRYIQNIKNPTGFYKISSFEKTESIVNEYGKERQLLTIEENILSSIEQQERLEDDYDSHNEIIPSFAHVYNGRINISGIRTKLFSGYPMESMVPYTYVEGEKNYTWHTKTFLEIEGREVAVVSESNILLYENPAYIYYPSTSVKKFHLHKYDSSTEVITSLSIERDAEVHKLLNGAYWLSPTFGTDDGYTFASGYPQPSGFLYLSHPNKIYTSEVNNPFYFPLSGRYDIGTGKIIAITSNTQAVSPGQFGEYPLILFSSDGVWAMQTGEEGLYYSIHPISRDICTNPNVLQTDGPVLFATENGLHSILGSSIENISKNLKGKPENVNIPVWDEKFTILANTAIDNETFNQFIKDAIFVYDYTNSRILAYKRGKQFAYVISTETGMTSKIVLLKDGNAVSFDSAVKSYPEVYMQSGTDIYTFLPDKDNGSLLNGLLVTRPIVFSEPLAMKIINDVKLIYSRTNQNSTCKYAMLVSNDGFKWSQCYSLRGRSYKYFRFVVFANLADTDALQGISVLFDYRRTNKLR